MKKQNNEIITKRGSMQVFYNMADYLMSTPKTLKDVFEIHTRFAIRDKNVFVYLYEEANKPSSLKYKDYYDAVLCFSKAISQTLVNIEKDSFIAFKMSNCIQWPLSFWGLIAAGYKPVLISPILGKEETEKLIRESGAKAIITEDEKVYSIPSFNIHKIKIGDHKDYVDQWANEVAFCTSGTTGDSRIFVYDGQAISYQLYSAYDMPKTTADIMYVGDIRLLAVIPFSHIFGFVAIFLWYTYFGMTIVFPKSNKPQDLLDACKKHNCSHIYAVPLFWDTVTKKFKQGLSEEAPRKQALVKKAMDYHNGYITKSEAGLASSNLVLKQIQKKVLGKQIVYCISGGSALSEETLLTMNGIGYNLYNGYGMSEIGITSVELSPDVKQRNKGSVGKPLVGVTYKLEDGELLVKSPYIHTSRLIGGKKYPSDVDIDGYFHTGDIATIDEQGYLYIKGKKKDVIIGSNGENIYPDEIEVRFQSLPFVKAVCVIGVKKNNDEIVTLIINLEKELKKEESEQLANAIKNVNDSLPFQMQVRECYIDKEIIPTNSSMKIKKYELIDDFQNHQENFAKMENGVSISFVEFDQKEVNEIVNQVENIIAEALCIDKDKIALNSDIISDLGGDSFTYMSVIASIEDEFRIKIPSEMIGKLNTPSQFALYILKKRHQLL